MKHQLRVAIADDDPVSREFVRRTVKLMGHDVICVAEDGRQLADACVAVQPDLIITDVNMPRLDGISAAAEVTSQHDIPVILLSGNELPSEIELLSHVNVLAKRLKPISRAGLEAVIEEAAVLSGSLATMT
jgi:response regulator NasT